MAASRKGVRGLKIIIKRVAYRKDDGTSGFTDMLDEECEVNTDTDAALCDALRKSARTAYWMMKPFLSIRLVRCSSSGNRIQVYVEYDGKDAANE